MNNDINKQKQKANILLICVVNRGKGSQVMNLLGEQGSENAVCTFAEGTIPSHILSMLGLAKSKKELVLATIHDEIEDACYQALADEMKLNQTGHGVAFSVPLCTHPEPSEHSTHSAALVIVDKGKAEDVLDVFDDLGLRGGTTLSAFGGASFAKILFNIPVQPEKEVVFLVARKEPISKMLGSLGEVMKMNEPNQGIAINFAISRSMGLYIEEQEGS